MKTLEHFRDRIRTVSDIKTIVSTMKTLAAARIRQFESVANATNSYDETIELALQLLMQHPDCPLRLLPDSQPTRVVGMVLLGSDQGFCGRFNENIVANAVKFRDKEFANGEIRLIGLGRKLEAVLQTRGLDAEQIFSFPASVSGLNSLVHDVLQAVNQWRVKDQIDTIQLVYSQRRKAASPLVVRQQILPPSRQWLQSLASRPWGVNSLPICSVSWTTAFSSTVQQWLFIQVYRCIAESLASENSSRISAMRKAENNIDAHLEDLNLEFNRTRQQSITEELRDILAGVDAEHNTEGKLM